MELFLFLVYAAGNSVALTAGLISLYDAVNKSELQERHNSVWKAIGRLTLAVLFGVTAAHFAP